ncbi:MAG TPA: glycoside hydrolase family 78 protein [Puia sp.]|nr:glycoside hydrolase family 78 protein [Puia sp.]
MKLRLFTLFVFTYLLLIAAVYAAVGPISPAGPASATALRPPSPCIPVALKCEYLSAPIGIDAVHPRLSWQMMDGRQGARQTAYRIYVGTDSLEISRIAGNGARSGPGGWTEYPPLSGSSSRVMPRAGSLVWASGKVASSATRISYQGQPLQPFTKYFWRVEVWDKDGRTAPAAISHFETGLMSQHNWKGSWISDDKDPHFQPAPYFRKTFDIPKKIRSARAYIAVAGLYELYINGEKVGDHRLDPMYTRFDRRTLYVTYDVTAQLREGKNALGVLLGNGWYNHQSTAVWNFDKAPWRGRPTFCLDLRLVYEDGSTVTITSDKHWKTASGPLVFNSIYTAEHYDARLEQPGWNTANFDDTAWKAVIYRSAPSPHIVAQNLAPIRNVEVIPVKDLHTFSDTDYVFDLGRNIAGVSRITVKGEAGTTLRLRHAERLYPNGHTDQSNIDIHYRPTDDKDPYQTDIFILGGRGTESFMPHFNYKGFQYVEVTSDRPIQLTRESLTGYFMHSDVEPVGQIRSSNPTLDKIWTATNHSYLSNLFGYPTDCPQREKNGWTGDAHIAVETGLYNFDGITVYEKWMADHRDEQQPDGVLPSIIPTGGWGYEWGNGPDWTSTIALIPWNCYLFYGDTTLLADCYENIRRYVDHIDELYPSGLTTWGLGDWVPVKSVSPVELTSSIYYYKDVTILAKAALLFGRQADRLKYQTLADKIRNAINAKYLDRATGIYGSGLQTELSAPLCWGVVPDELKARVADNLARRVAADSDHLDAGILGAKAILNALSENGHAEVAYRLAAQETYPSWGWWMVNGATTLYENWKIDAKSDISLNHIMFGEIGAWLYKGLGGIRPDPEQPGFKHILLEPHFVTGLDHFEAAHEGPYGKIVSSWKREGAVVHYTVTIPPNSTATLWLPASAGRLTGATPAVPAGGTRKPTELSAGTYRFEIR